MAKDDLKNVIKRVGTKYIQAPKYLRVTIGEMLAGKIQEDCKNK